MKKILYFCNCNLKVKNGHGQVIRAHHKMLNQLYPNQVTTVMISDDMSNKEYFCMPYPSQREKMIAVLNGYSPDLSLESIHTLLKLIDEREIDIVFIESSMFGNLIRQIKRNRPKIKVLTYFTDIQADLLRQEMRHSGLKRKLVCLKLIKNEKQTVKYADKKIVLNKRDENMYKKIYKKKPDAIIPIIISKKSVSYSNNFHYSGDKLKVLFVGGDFWPNVDGIRWFIDKVLPSVSAPCEVEVVGLNMEKYRDELESKSSVVHVIGTVDDIEPYYEKADLFIAPVRDGGGMKVKTAEALSYGKTFIGLEESLTGYWEFIPEFLKNESIFLCDNEQEFARRISDFYNQTFDKSRKDIVDFIESLCSYDVNFKTFKRLFEE